MYRWDRRKSRANKKKHGISFEEARDFIFEGVNVLVGGVAYDRGESRHAIMGTFQGKYYVGIFTVRDGIIRIISVRRARSEEEKEARAKGI